MPQPDWGRRGDEAWQFVGALKLLTAFLVCLLRRLRLSTEQWLLLQRGSAEVIDNMG